MKGCNQNRSMKLGGLGRPVRLAKFVLIRKQVTVLAMLKRAIVRTEKRKTRGSEGPSLLNLLSGKIWVPRKISQRLNVKKKALTVVD